MHYSKILPLLCVLFNLPPGRVLKMVTLRSGLIVVRRGVLPRQHGCSSWDETWTSWNAFTDRRSMTRRKPGLNLATTDFWSWSASLTLIKFDVLPQVLINLFINNTVCLFGAPLCCVFSVSVSYLFFWSYVVFSSLPSSQAANHFCANWCSNF